MLALFVCVCVFVLFMLCVRRISTSQFVSRFIPIKKLKNIVPRQYGIFSLGSLYVFNVLVTFMIVYVRDKTLSHFFCVDFGPKVFFHRT